MLRALETCRMYIYLLCATPGGPESDRPRSPVDGRVEEIQDNKLDIYAFRGSDKAIVVRKPANKGEEMDYLGNGGAGGAKGLG